MAGSHVTATCSVEGCGRDHAARGWCMAHYDTWRVYGSATPSEGARALRHMARLRARFWKSVRVSGPDECWEWQGPRLPKGYGYFGSSKGVLGRQYAHRLAWRFTHGESLLGDAVVRHSCDNPPCCNPAHLSVGSQGDNVMDAVARRRHPHGETHGSARFTERDIREMRRLAASGLSQVAIAAAFQTNKGTVNDIVRRRTWRHVT